MELYGTMLLEEKFREVPELHGTELYKGSDGTEQLWLEPFT